MSCDHQQMGRHFAFSSASASTRCPKDPTAARLQELDWCQATGPVQHLSQISIRASCFAELQVPKVGEVPDVLHAEPSPRK